MFSNKRWSIPIEAFFAFWMFVVLPLAAYFWVALYNSSISNGCKTNWPYTISEIREIQEHCKKAFLEWIWLSKEVKDINKQDIEKIREKYFITDKTTIQDLSQFYCETLKEKEKNSNEVCSSLENKENNNEILKSTDIENKEKENSKNLIIEEKENLNDLIIEVKDNKVKENDLRSCEELLNDNLEINLDHRCVQHYKDNWKLLLINSPERIICKNNFDERVRIYSTEKCYEYYKEFIKQEENK